MHRTTEAIRLAAIEPSQYTAVGLNHVKELARAQAAGVRITDFLRAHLALRVTGEAGRAAALIEDGDEDVPIGGRKEAYGNGRIP
jgi:hypothetical protein